MADAPAARLAIKVDVVSDVVCPWCYIGKRRLERAIALVPELDVEVRWHPFFLNPWVPREGISREDYLTKKFGSVEAYGRISQRVVQEAAGEGLTYRPDLVKRQPNTIDCHRLILWAGAAGRAPEMKQRLMELYFRDGGDLTDRAVLVQAAADCGLDADEIRDRLESDAEVDLVTAAAQQAAEAGVSGVPTYVLGDRYALSGAQPPEQLARALRQTAAEQAAG
jgi:predicted DsbA family dithiol-disulfide isomerase